VITFGFLAILLPLLIANPIVAVRIHLKPLRELARQRRLRIQFALTDILLLLAMQGVSGSVLSTIPNSNDRILAMLTIWLPIAVAWYYAVRLVSQAGIAATARRLWIIGVAVPFAAFGIYFLLALLLSVSTSSIVNTSGALHIEEIHIHLFWMKIKTTSAGAALFSNILMGLWSLLLVTWLFLPRRLARWAIAAQGYIPTPQTTELPQTPSDAPLLDPHVKDLKLK